MGRRLAEIASTPRLKAVQEQIVSRQTYARLAASARNSSPVSSRGTIHSLARQFLYRNGERDRLAQYRVGTAGLLHEFDKNTIGFADLSGGRRLNCS